MKLNLILLLVLFSNFSTVNGVLENSGNNFFILSKIYFENGNYDSSFRSFTQAIKENAYNAHRPYSVYKYIFAAVSSGNKNSIEAALAHAKFIGINHSDIATNKLLRDYTDSLTPVFEQLQESDMYYFSLDTLLVTVIDEMKNNDQARHLGNTYKIDSVNFIRFKEILASCGFPTQKTVGYKGMNDVYLLMQHFYLAFPEEQTWLLSVVSEQINKGFYDPHEYVVLVDRALAFNNQKIRYGSLLSRKHTTNNELSIMPTLDIEQLDYRRKKIGVEPLIYYLQDNGVKTLPESYQQPDFREIYRGEISQLKN